MGSSPSRCAETQSWMAPWPAWKSIGAAPIDSEATDCGRSAA